MSTLQEYLVEKRAKVRANRTPAALAAATAGVQKAVVTVEGRSGVRRIRIRDFQVILDSGPNLAGYDLGPSSQELFLGTVASCVTHTFLIHAADLEIPLDAVRVEITAVQDPRAGTPGFEDVPIYPHDISYTAHITSSAPTEDIQRLHAVVQARCPLFNLVQTGQKIEAHLELTRA